MKLFLFKTNFLLLILLVLFACSVDDTTSITPATTELAIDYEISGNFYMALTNNAIELEQKRDFVSQSNFFVSPSLPNGLSLDVTNGNISGTPTKTSLPTSYTITANVDGKSYTKVLFLGVSPSQVWVTNVNSTQPYNLTAYVVGDGDKQAGVSWSSSDKTIAMVNGGMVSLLLTATPGTAVISASKNSYSNGVAFTISKVTDLDGGKIIKERENRYLIITNGTKTIKTGQFEDKYLTSVVIPEGVTSIGDNAFKDNYYLTSVDIPKGVTSIGDNAFSSSGLISLVIPKGVTNIGSDAFNGGKLTSVVIPDSVTKIKNRAFANNGLTNLVIPNSLTSISEYAFAYSKLTSIVIPDSVTNIEKKAFSGNELKDLVIGSRVNNIGEAAFANNKLLKVIIPNSVTNIEKSAFSGNELKDLVIGSRVNSIGDSAFYDNKLIDVVIPNSVKSIGPFAFQENELTRVVISDGITIIERSAFKKNKLASVVIGTNVVSIDSEAFSINELTSVVIPDSVTSVSSHSFANNRKLVEVSLKQSLYDKYDDRSRGLAFGTQVTNYIKRP